MNSWTSYPKAYNPGHRAIATLFDGPVRIEEKVDGSQFSFGVIDGSLRFKSKRQEFFIENAQALFKPAVETVVALYEAGKLQDGWTYRAEAVCKPKHNTLQYERTPKGGLILFDIAIGYEDYATRELLEAEAESLGLEVVPVFYEGMVENFEQLQSFLNNVSVLGKANIEGVVIKTSGRFGEDGKPIQGKYVTEAFKELHQKDWKKENNPSKGDILLKLGTNLRSTARWTKAVQRLRDEGQITDTPADIGRIIKEVQNDCKEECDHMVKEMLFNWAWPQIERKIIAGLPMWYKDELAKSAFDEAG